MCIAFAENDRRYETLSKGDKSENVKQLQIALIAQGYLKGSADGDFGKMTEAAVTRFQSDYGIKANGIADEKTLELLYELESERVEKAKTDGLETPDAASKKEKTVKKEDETVREIGGKTIDQYSVEELINICCAIKKEVSKWNDIEPFDVPVGKWTVGEHLNPGIYSITSIDPNDSSDWEEVDFQITFVNGSGQAHHMRSQSLSGSFHHIPLSIGDQIEIEDKSATFSEGIQFPEYEGEDDSKIAIDFTDYDYEELVLTYSAIIEELANKEIPEMTICAGVWIVGKDIPEGTYNISAYIEDGANYDFYVISNISKLLDYAYGDDVLYEMEGYGKDAGTNASNCELSNGNVIVTRGCMAKLTVFDNNVFFGK